MSSTKQFLQEYHSGKVFVKTIEIERVLANTLGVEDNFCEFEESPQMLPYHTLKLRFALDP